MTSAPSQSPVRDLADRFWDWFLTTNPTFATMLGDERFDDRLDDPSPEGRAAEVSDIHRFMGEAAGIDGSALDTEERITLDMLQVVGRIRLRAHEHRLYQFEAIDQMAGPQSLPSDLAPFQRVDTPERFERLLTRLRAFPAHLAAHQANFQEGVREGRTAARPVFERTITQVRRAVDTPADQSPLLGADKPLDDDQRATLRGVLEDVVRPALVSYLAALEEALPSARSGDGLWSLPDGEAVYRTLILASTTLEDEPQVFHDFGLEQIGLIDAERLVIAQELGFADVAALRASLEEDPANRPASRKALVELAREQIKRAEAVAPTMFGRLPRAACEVRPVEAYQEAEAPPAFYFPPAPDGSRPGIYYINTYEPDSRRVHRLASTTYHEAVPGHHFQITIESELEDLPDFRRYGARLTGAAYPEGWGLYSERLADEMGLYVDARERLGMLDAQAWRAARLVVDTGIHAFRWDRQRAIDVLQEAAGLSQLEAATETDRYIAWPGQALSYMTGQREISALRRQLEERDGERFDLSAFHDEVLGHGSLSLATLRRELPNWVKPRDA
jgi:uncharacterized protein (DUF885 family)